MALTPFQILSIWVKGLLSLVLLLLGPYLLYEWYQRAHIQRFVVDDVTVPATQSAVTADNVESGHTQREFAPHWGFNSQTSFLLVGLLATLFAIPKAPLNFTRLRRRRGVDEPDHVRKGEVRNLERPDGSILRVEMYGPEDGPPVVFTHGWGLDSTEWYYAKKQFAGSRLIVWDLPGLGLSKKPDNNDYSLDNLAGHLDAVIEVAGGRPVVLVGHSIGGMISLTFCKLFPQAMGSRVCGLALVNTTFTNPLRTTGKAKLDTALQKPLIEPLLHLTIWLAPVVWLMNWMSYLNGSTHRSSERSGFSGNETRGQLDFVASYGPRAWPAVTARGMLGMLRYDATETLRTISVPTLIVTGNRDSVCTPEASEHMRAEIPNAEIATLAPAKHQALIEHHQRFSEIVNGFVTRCSKRDPAYAI